LNRCQAPAPRRLWTHKQIWHPRRSQPPSS